MRSKSLDGRKARLPAMSHHGLTKAERQALKKERKKNRYLEKELNRKEKALAETAALLVLKKKAQALWGEPEDE